MAGNEEVYLGSADLMPRNLNRRVERSFRSVRRGWFVACAPRFWIATFRRCQRSLHDEPARQHVRAHEARYAGTSLVCDGTRPGSVGLLHGATQLAVTDDSGNSGSTERWARSAPLARIAAPATSGTWSDCERIRQRMDPHRRPWRLGRRGLPVPTRPAEGRDHQGRDASVLLQVRTSCETTHTSLIAIFGIPEPSHGEEVAAAIVSDRPLLSATYAASGRSRPAVQHPDGTAEPDRVAQEPFGQSRRETRAPRTARSGRLGPAADRGIWSLASGTPDAGNRLSLASGRIRPRPRPRLHSG